MVEDSTETLEMYADVLHFWGFRTEVAVTAPEAVEKAEALHPAAIVLDLSLTPHVMDGLEVLRRFKWNSRTRRIPVVVVTGHALPSDEEKVWSAGADGFITKPAYPDELVAQIAHAMRRDKDECPE